MLDARLHHPYLTQGRNYPIPKFYYKWTYLPETTGRHQCKYKIDRVMVKSGSVVRHCCQKYEGHGTDHSWDEIETSRLNRMKSNISIELALLQHINNEFGDNGMRYGWKWK